VDLAILDFSCHFDVGVFLYEVKTMAEFTGEKWERNTHSDDCYSYGYVRWLEKQVATLTKSNDVLRRRLRSYEVESRRKTQAYQDQVDFVPYPDEDRD